MTVNQERGCWNRPVVLGIDFDNTLACYDELFHSLAVERGLIRRSTPRTKRSVRDALREQGYEKQWTELQGIAYGQRLLEAPPFRSAVETLGELHRSGIALRIVSHKTRLPARGPGFDLRQSALGWLAYNRVLEPERTGIGRAQVFFEDSQTDKRARIRTLGCTHFVDDLREFLLHPDFPSGVRRILFDPSGAGATLESVRAVTHWDQIRECFIDRDASGDVDTSHCRFYRSIQ